MLQVLCTRQLTFLLDFLEKDQLEPVLKVYLSISFEHFKELSINEGTQLYSYKM